MSLVVPLTITRFLGSKNTSLLKRFTEFGEGKDLSCGILSQIIIQETLLS
jgi:hypothetical protein